MHTISIVEDDCFFRELLLRGLSKSNKVRVISHHSSGEDALRKLPLHPPDVVLLDIKMPRMNGIECLRRLKSGPTPLRSQVLMLTGCADSDSIFEALTAGADGYLLKDSEIVKDLSAHIEELFSGGGPMSPAIARKTMHFFRNCQVQRVTADTHTHARRAAGGAALPAPFTSLTCRQMQILEKIADGLAYKQIAADLGIALDTVRHLVTKVYRKLQVQSRAEAALLYYQALAAQQGAKLTQPANRGRAGGSVN